METKVNDLLLIYHGQTPLGYARVEDITADVKPGWWHLSMLLLKFPPQHVTWILRDEYIDGQSFAMGGEEMRLERLPRPSGVCDAKAAEPQKTEQAPSAPGGERGKIIQLRPRVWDKPEDDNIA